jgi:hypothetical protein
MPFNAAKTTARGYFGSRSAVWDVNKIDPDTGKVVGGYIRGGFLGGVRNMFGM